MLDERLAAAAVDPGPAVVIDRLIDEMALRLRGWPIEQRLGRDLCQTVDNLFIDIANEHWVSKKEAHAMNITAATKLPSLKGTNWL